MERIAGHDSSMLSMGGSALQRKVRLKTTKQYRFATEKGGGARPASSMSYSQQIRQGSEGRTSQSSAGAKGMVTLSVTNQKPIQFKILSNGASASKGPQRDRSNNSSNPRQSEVILAGQPQISRQQLQRQLQQKQLGGGGRAAGQLECAKEVKQVYATI